jgi:hypothetical protein
MCCDWFASSLNLEYNRTLEIMELKTLPSLKKCLVLNPERVLPALYEYEEAHIVFQDTLHKFLYHSKIWIITNDMYLFRTKRRLCEVQRIILSLIE